MPNELGPEPKPEAIPSPPSDESDSTAATAALSVGAVVESRSVAWWPVHEFVTELVAQANALPTAGTPSWCALMDCDPAKLVAVAVAGEHWVLRTETAQEARAEASKAIAASTDWPKVAQEVRQREAFRKANPWVTRVTA